MISETCITNSIIDVKISIADIIKSIIDISNSN